MPYLFPEFTSPYPSYDRLKPIIIEIASVVLAISATLIMGLLSLCGQLVFSPSIVLAVASFIFSAVIEGQIYIKSTHGALTHLTDPKAYEHQLTEAYLNEKLKNFDKNRNKFLLHDPNENDKELVLKHNQILIIRLKEPINTYAMGFCNAENQYEQIVLDDTTMECLDLTEENYFLNFLKNTQEEQFIDSSSHFATIDTLYQSAFGGPEKVERPQILYPSFINAYAAQLPYIRQFSEYLSTQAKTEENQQIALQMQSHLKEIEETVSEHLFDSKNNAPILNKIHSFKFRKITYDLDLATMKLQVNMADVNTCNQPTDFSLDALPEKIKIQLYEKYHAYQLQELKKWIAPDKDQWHKNLVWHTFYCRFALLIGGVSAVVMQLGSTYLIMEAFAAIPLLATIPLSLFPFVIIPLAVITGLAHGATIFYSISDMIINNPFTKFYEKISTQWTHASLKSKLMMISSIFLFILTLFLTFCNIETWLTVFNQTAPLFTWMALIPQYFLTAVIPILLGLSVMPFSLQSIANTLEGLEESPHFNTLLNWLSGRFTSSIRLPHSREELKILLGNYLIPIFFGVTPEAFAKETLGQQCNLLRMVSRLHGLFTVVLFIGHLTSAGDASAQTNYILPWVAFLINFLYEGLEDLGWIMPHPHAKNPDTPTLLKEHFQGGDDHDHNSTLPARFLKFIFDPIFWGAAHWDNYFRDRNNTEEADNVENRYNKLWGLKPKDSPTPNIPIYRQSGNFKLFLFESNAAPAKVMNDFCCGPKM